MTYELNYNGNTYDLVENSDYQTKKTEQDNEITAIQNSITDIGSQRFNQLDILWSGTQECNNTSVTITLSQPVENYQMIIVTHECVNLMQATLTGGTYTNDDSLAHTNTTTYPVIHGGLVDPVNSQSYSIMGYMYNYHGQWLKPTSSTPEVRLVLESLAIRINGTTCILDNTGRVSNMGMQSTTGSGSSYDGLNFTSNTSLPSGWKITKIEGVSFA